MIHMLHMDQIFLPKLKPSSSDGKSQENVFYAWKISDWSNPIESSDYYCENAFHSPLPSRFLRHGHISIDAKITKKHWMKSISNTILVCPSVKDRSIHKLQPNQTKKSNNNNTSIIHVSRSSRNAQRRGFAAKCKPLRAWCERSYRCVCMVCMALITTLVLCVRSNFFGVSNYGKSMSCFIFDSYSPSV